MSVCLVAGTRFAMYCPRAVPMGTTCQYLDYSLVHNFRDALCHGPPVQVHTHMRHGSWSLGTGL